jgi:hypothetical protein
VLLVVVVVVVVLLLSQTALVNVAFVYLVWQVVMTATADFERLEGFFLLSDRENQL